ncbi:hypothetical protein SNEBB_002418 [Seison nebaliae]|nr:hypothetical protein SNEBB_002418 [Seison nebaliae]
MGRDNIDAKNNLLKKLKGFYAASLDHDKDGLITWKDMETAIENVVPKDDADKNSRLKIVRKRLEQHYQRYFWDLCAVGDANNDGNIDFDEWLDVINDVIQQLKDKNSFPDWYEGLHKALFRAHEFLDERDILKEEFCDMLACWNISEDGAANAYDAITENGKVKMDYNLFSEFLKKFMVGDLPGDRLNLGFA